MAKTHLAIARRGADIEILYAGPDGGAAKDAYKQARGTVPYAAVGLFLETSHRKATPAPPAPPAAKPAKAKRVRSKKS